MLNHLSHPGAPERKFIYLLFVYLLTYFNVYLFLRERQGTSRGGAEREGDTESEAGFGLQAVSTEPDAGLEPMSCEIMT